MSAYIVSEPEIVEGLAVRLVDTKERSVKWVTSGRVPKVFQTMSAAMSSCSAKARAFNLMHGEGFAQIIKVKAEVDGLAWRVKSSVPVKQAPLEDPLVWVDIKYGEGDG